ncbi:MAG TPA: DinB family protein [Candidatus Acidoferrales bacterium]|nr:DinB family protein [Candidatus Acidoferrales bacterium]
MREIDRILDQMDRAFSGDAWHGPSLMSLLEGIPAEDASKHAVPGAHSIWELVHHMASWYTIVLHRLQSDSVEVTAERDWPPVWEVSDTAWKRALDNLSENRERLRSVVARLQDDQLDLTDQPTSGGNASRYVVLHGLIQHDLYHAGQIAILKKAIA